MAPLLKNRTQIRKLASDLGLAAHGDAVEAILQFCAKRIRDVLREFPHCTTPSLLLEALANKLGTTFHVVRTDLELRQLRSRFLNQGETSFARLEGELDPGTYGITLRRRQRQLWEPEFVSVIDCRGQKAYRENYTKWHEIGHLLVLADQNRSSFRRTHCTETTTTEPEETLVDIIAGSFAFLPEMIQPHIHGNVSFELIEEIREKLCPEASRQSALIGIVKAWPSPCLLVRAELGLRRREKLELQQGSFDFRESPVPVLRAVKVAQSGSARESNFAIRPNMRVPKQSIIYKIFEIGSGSGDQKEDLSWWESSDGGALPPKKVVVQARYGFDGIDALVTPRTG